MQLLGLAAVYGGIRADLKHVKEGVSAAHKRIDDLLMKVG